MRKPKDNSLKNNMIVQGVDLPFLVFIILLITAGLLILFTASHVNAYFNYGDSYYFIKKQVLFALIGIIPLTLGITIPVSVYRKWAYPLLGVSIILLIMVLAIGETVNNARRWISLPIIGGFQPSEIAKLAIIFSFSKYITKYHSQMRTFKHGILPFATVLGLVAGLVLIEPHLSGAVLICAVGAIMMIAGGSNLGWFAGAAGGAGLIGVYVVFFSNIAVHAKDRIAVWLDPFIDPAGKGWQTIQSLYAIGSGGFFGLGLGNSRQKHLYIPEPQNDFIFSIACEELGFIGALIIIILFALLVWRGFMIAFRAPDKFSSLIVLGIISRVAIQTIINIGVVSNLLPNTGISLPFFSSGGTSLLILMFEMGVVLGVSRKSTSIKR